MVRINLMKPLPPPRPSRRLYWTSAVMVLVLAIVSIWIRPSVLQGSNGPDPSLRLFVFVSQSMPQSYVRDIQTQIGRIRQFPVTFVVRGTTSDKVIPDAQYWTQAPDGTQIPLWIDPLLFAKYDIQAVPSFVLVSGYDTNCPSCPDSPDTQAWMVRGATSLEHVLERMSDHSGHPVIAEALSEVRSGFFRR